MARFYKDRKDSLGKRPGELVFVGKIKNEKIRVSLIDYNGEDLREEQRETIVENREYLKSKSISWINVDGLHDLDLMEKTGEHLDLHPMVVADILNTDQRPRIEEIKNGLFFVLKMLRYDEKEDLIVAEQFSMVLKKNLLLTFQEQPGDVFDPVRVRLREKKGRIREKGADYLAYSLIDSIVDNYISIIEKIGSRIEDNEENLLYSRPDKKMMEEITLLKREMIYLRKSIRPAIEAIQFFSKIENDQITESTLPFIKDLLSNITQASEAIDIYREMLTEQMNSYNSMVSNNLNDIMKFLTIFSVIFIPLTFLAGVYGMNFEHIPELQYPYSYPIIWGVFLLLAGIMIWIFKKKKWF